MSCPICRAQSVDTYRPFCSKRCADIDLGRWMNGSYAVPSEREFDPEEVAKALGEASEENNADSLDKPH
ncbi:DNA gyrase inhibitor YacG [Celeribacter marinus]|uniref:DNA gyrase inhibitor YacG n=1 Tax=Celeribacter marinus TaxID=1397108 RepID=UPI003171D964